MLRTHYVQFLEEHTGQLQRAPPMAHASNAAAKVDRQSTARARVCVRMCVCVQVKGKNSGNRGLGKGGPGASMQEAKSENWFTGNS